MLQSWTFEKIQPLIERCERLGGEAPNYLTEERLQASANYLYRAKRLALALQSKGMNDYGLYFRASGAMHILNAHHLLARAAENEECA